MTGYLYYSMHYALIKPISLAHIPHTSGRRLQNKPASRYDGNKQTWYAEEAYDELATVRKIIVSNSNSRVYYLQTAMHCVQTAVHCVQSAVHCV